jgi:probable aminopeptidase NPEPL1
LVGKGIVFDTGLFTAIGFDATWCLGGMQIKGKTAMPTMKVSLYSIWLSFSILFQIDMGGSAAVLAAFCALVKSGFKQELHCLLCIAENNIS